MFKINIRINNILYTIYYYNYNELLIKLIKCIKKKTKMKYKEKKVKSSKIENLNDERENKRYKENGLLLLSKSIKRLML